MDYNRTIRLKGKQLPAAIDQETGEVIVLRKKPNNIPDHKELHKVDSPFKKDYVNSWKFLRRELTPSEMYACNGLVLLAAAYTNSLRPLNDDTVLKELVDVLGVSINRVKHVLKKLYILGVYGKFDVYEVHKEYTKYWVLNPYLSFNGKLINSDIKDLFAGTHLRYASEDPEYRIK